MNLNKTFLDNIRNRVALKDVISPKVPLTQKGRLFWGCCPFHNEKTGSFCVNEEKGFYHCFGCGAHGDIISFEMNVNNLSFPEAVSKLADIAGLEMPQFSESDRHQAKKEAGIKEIIEISAKFFENELYSDEGKQALQYLKEKRGFTDETITRFRIGYAPSNNKLFHHLKGLNISEEQIFTSGVIRKSEQYGSYYDYFRNRVVFPITDKQGRVIAFSARVLDDSQPKYLNSSDSDVFHKSYVLYGQAQAAKMSYDKKQIIVVEGQTDVISLSQEGIENIVAPLGTALTEHHVSALWRYSQSPTLCFDGDNAGIKAGIRAAYRTLPVLKEGYSLDFVYLPQGHDPDSIIKEKGLDKFNNILLKTKSLSQIIWEDIKSKFPKSTPEQKAMFEAEIKRVIETIENPNVKKFYQSFLIGKMWDTFRENRPNTNKKSSFVRPAKKSNQTLIISKDTVIYDDGIFKSLLSYMVKFPTIFTDKIENENLLKSSNNEIKSAIQHILNFITINSTENLNSKSIQQSLKENDFNTLLNSIKIDLFAINSEDQTTAEINVQILLTEVEKQDIKSQMEQAIDDGNFKLFKKLKNDLTEKEMEIESLSLSK